MISERTEHCAAVLAASLPSRLGTYLIVPRVSAVMLVLHWSVYSRGFPQLCLPCIGRRALLSFILACDFHLLAFEKLAYLVPATSHSGGW